MKVSNLSQQVRAAATNANNAIAFVPEQFVKVPCDGKIFSYGPFKALMVKTSQGLTTKCLSSDSRGNLSLKKFDRFNPHPGTLFLVTAA